MTWTIKQRGAPSGVTVAEYECPVHGRFERVVERYPSGNPPDAVDCESELEYPRRIVHAYDEDGTEHVHYEHFCGERSEWRISAPFGKVKVASVVQGKVAKAEKPTWTDTEKLGERGAIKEWRADRKKVWRDYRYETNVRDGRKGTA